MEFRISILYKGLLLRIMVMAAVLFSTQGMAEVSNPDHKVWISQKFSSRIDKKRTLNLEINQRFDDDASRWEEFYINTGLAFKLNRNWTVEPGYRHVRDRFGSSEEETENRLHLAFTWKTSSGRMKYSLRTRYEYRMFESGKTSRRITEKIKIARSVGKSGLLYIADEIDYELDVSQIRVHEIHVGYEFPMGENTVLNLYYGHEIKKRNSEWSRRTHIAGLEVAREY